MWHIFRYVYIINLENEYSWQNECNLKHLCVNNKVLFDAEGNLIPIHLNVFNAVKNISAKLFLTKMIISQFC